MNIHLNVFRPFGEPNDQDYLENSLSRAFALCLKHDPLFFIQYIQAIVSFPDFEYLFAVHGSDDMPDVDIQQNMSAVNIDAVQKVYAVAMTTDLNLSMVDFLSQAPLPNQERHITDVWMQIKDIAIVIEVKRNGGDCKQQLYNQIRPFLQRRAPATVEPVNFSWTSVIDLMEKISTAHHLTKNRDVFIKDFLALSEQRYPDWYPSRPFAVIPFSTEAKAMSFTLLNKRLRQCLAQTGYEFVSDARPQSVAVPFYWATEVEAGFSEYQQGERYLTLTIWPGNTRGQGYPIYNQPLDWVDESELLIDDHPYELDISFNIKFCHWNKFITGLTFYSNDLIASPIHTRDNFLNKSGRWQRDQWPELVDFLDNHLQPEYNWREKVKFDLHFTNTDRQYLTCSFGFEVSLFIPFIELTELDKRSEDLPTTSARLRCLIDGLQGLI